MMKYWLFAGLLVGVVQVFYAQNWTPQDSLRLQQLLQQTGELELNPEALKVLGVETPVAHPQVSSQKPWLDFREDVPLFPEEKQKKVVLTLHPYAPGTPYNWDPIRQRKIQVGKNTWRGAFYELKSRAYPSNWAKNPLDAGDRSSLEKIEATGLRYVVQERAHNLGVGGLKPTGGGAGIYGLDLMMPFTKEFWQFRRRKNRKRTLQILRVYALDSVMVR